MRQAIANLIEVARLSFNAKGPASPVSPFNSSARRNTSHIYTARAKTNLKDQPMLPFAKSPLADSDYQSAAATDAILAVFGDGDVQRQAAAVRAKLLHVIEFAALRSEIAAAVKAIGTHSTTDLTPAAVVAFLRQRAAELDDALDDARADRDAHEQVRNMRLCQLRPLRLAVSTRVATLTAERANCLTRIDASRRASDMSGAAVHRYNSLVAAGLSNDQIKALGPDCQSPADQKGALKDRMAAIDAELVPLREFSASGDLAHLAGLGLNDLVAQAFPESVGEEAAA